MLTEIGRRRSGTKAGRSLSPGSDLGLSNAAIDAEGNVVGVRKGTGNGPKLVISAHLDTVFPIRHRCEGEGARRQAVCARYFGQHARLAVLLSWLKVLNDQKIATVGDLVFVGNVGEEELGNLRGMKHLFKEHLDIDGMVALEPGPMARCWCWHGQPPPRGDLQGPGGHSYAAFGEVPSAIRHGPRHPPLPRSPRSARQEPRTTFTVGTVGGGTIVNTIAPDARMAVDIRSDEMAPLLATEKQVLAAVDSAVTEENARWGVNTLSASTKLIGDRPGVPPPPTR